MSKKLQVYIYILFDVLASVIAWTSFFVYRKWVVETAVFGYEIPLDFDLNYWFGVAILPSYWVFLYYLIGSYKEVFRKSRLKEFGETLLMTLTGSLVLFFVLILDDVIGSYKNYYSMFLFLLCCQFVLVALFRFIITTITGNKIKRRQIGFNTIIVGSNQKACDLYSELEGQKESFGNRFVGFVHLQEKTTFLLEEYLPHIGELNQIHELVSKYNVEEVIIAIESSEHKYINSIIQKMEGLSILIKVIPDMYDILTGSVKMSSIFGTPLIVIEREILPIWQQTTKRVIDVIVSLFVLTVFSPLYLIVGLIVKLTSKGPVFFSQERIGRHGKPFNIYKYRSMYVDAEKSGPALSSKSDPRITSFGKFLRKVRLDEIPQFYNVLVGDMSLVGPRPERQYFIDKISEVAPHYHHLLKVSPGITSWGQVKYGYAENVEQMVARLKYDIIYIENMSLLVDFKILIHTVLIVLKGAGK